MTDSADTLQLERGMRLRGLAMTRLETFVDAAFAFAVTLLVISVDDVPRSFEELVLALKNIPVFLAASAQLFLFWIAHRSWSGFTALMTRNCGAHPAARCQPAGDGVSAAHRVQLWRCGYNRWLDTSTF